MNLNPALAGAFFKGLNIIIAYNQRAFGDSARGLYFQEMAGEILEKGKARMPSLQLFESPECLNNTEVFYKWKPQDGDPSE